MRLGLATILSLPNASALGPRCRGPSSRTEGLLPGSGPCCSVISDPIYGYHRVNVEAQRRDPQSLLNWMERKIRRAENVRRSAGPIGEF
jgi:maltose alpha-D-glucosyltransferase / alpha-amylase